MIEIIDFKLVGYKVEKYQIITGNDSIKVLIVVKTKYPENLKNIRLDISNYSFEKIDKLAFTNIKDDIYEFENIFEVFYLGEDGIEVGKNSKLSRLKLIIKDFDGTEKIFYSNPIGNATYETFSKDDHHLGVYNKYDLDEILKRKKFIELSKNIDFPNDIIFINRKPGEKSILKLNHYLVFNDLFKEIMNRIIVKKDDLVILSYDYNKINCDFKELINNISKIIKLNKYIKIYFHNFPLCFFSSLGEEFVNDFVLYNGIYKILGVKYGNECNLCKFVGKCDGININYKNKYGFKNYPFN